MDAQLRGHTETIGQRMERYLDALPCQMPAVPYDACDKQSEPGESFVVVGPVAGPATTRCRWPSGHRDVLVRGYVNQVVISCGTEVMGQASPIIRTRRLRL